MTAPATYPTLNRELLEHHVQWVLDQDRDGSLPALWRQSVYIDQSQSGDVCGSFRCLAGNVVIEDERSRKQLLAPDYRGSVTLLRADDRDDNFDAYLHYDIGFQVISVAARARALLGLTEWEAALLFDAGNTAESIRRLADEILAGVFRDGADQ